MSGEAYTLAMHAQACQSVIPGPVVKIFDGRYSRVNLSLAHLTKPSGFWFLYCDSTLRHGEFLGRRTS